MHHHHFYYIAFLLKMILHFRCIHLCHYDTPLHRVASHFRYQPQMASSPPKVLLHEESGDPRMAIIDSDEGLVADNNID